MSIIPKIAKAMQTILTTNIDLSITIEILNAIVQNAGITVSELLNGIMGRIAKPICPYDKNNSYFMSLL